MALNYDRKPMTPDQERRVHADTARAVRGVKQVVAEVLAGASPNEQLQMVATLTIQGSIQAAGAAFEPKGVSDTIDAGLFESLLLGGGVAFGLLLGRLDPGTRMLATTTLLEAINAGIKETGQLNTPKGNS